MRWWVAAAVLAGVSAYGVAPALADQPLLAVMNTAVTVLFGVTAAVLASTAGQRANAQLVLAASATWTAGCLGSYHGGLLPLTEFLLVPFVFPVLAALILRYPGPRLLRSGDRLLVRTILVWVALCPISIALVTIPVDHGYRRPGIVWPSVGLATDVVGRVYLLGATVLVGLFFVAVARRWSAARGLDRPVAAPVVVASVALAVGVGADVTTRLLPEGPVLLPAVLAVECLGVLAVPVSFLASAIRRRLGHGAVASLVTTLARPAPVDTVEEELRRTLRDPTLQLLFRLPESTRLVDVHGRDADLDDGRARRAMYGTDGEVLGVVVLDELLGDHAEFVEAALAAAVLALENGRLQAAVRAQVDEVAAARARAVEAGVAERRRVERDLHDGVQQRMVVLKMRLAAARAGVTDPEHSQVLDEARREVAASLDELRDLARGLHPALLEHAGLEGAVRALTGRMPLEVALDIGEDRYAPTIEATVYFVVCEALTNAAKHADAHHVTVRIARVGGVLTVRVHDDGCGGAVVVEGGGLAGLRDRVGALGGSLAVSGGFGAGTELVVMVPCG